MNRIVVRAARLSRRRPLRARRAVARAIPMEYSPEPPAPRWLIVGTGVLGVLVAIELVVGLVVLG